MYGLSAATDIPAQNYNDQVFGLYVFRDGCDVPEHTHTGLSSSIDCADDRIIVLIHCEGHSQTDRSTLSGHIAARVARDTIVEEIRSSHKADTLRPALQTWHTLSNTLFSLANTNVIQALADRCPHDTRMTSGYLECNPADDQWIDIPGGTTCTLLIVADRVVYSANVGPSVCFCRDAANGRTIELVGDHTPTSTDEYQRINALNPHMNFVYDESGEDIFRHHPKRGCATRLVTRGGLGTLAMTRSIGDSLMHSAGVTCQPCVRTCDISPNMHIGLFPSATDRKRVEPMVHFGYSARVLVDMERKGNSTALTCYCLY